MEIYTIGFTQKSAQQFFELLKKAGIRSLWDIRIHNTSQLAGFAKRDDLAYFLQELGGIEYRHEPLLAPTGSLLKDYRDGRLDWASYAEQFDGLLEQRQIAHVLSRDAFNIPTALLCSEATPEQCHRRLVVDYLAQHWPDVGAVHL